MPTREITDGEMLKTLMCLADMFGDFGGDDELIEHIIQKIRQHEIHVVSDGTTNRIVIAGEDNGRETKWKMFKIIHECLNALNKKES